MSREQPRDERVIGPPGCGKTTFIQEQAQNASDDGKTFMIVSLTRAAAAAVYGRDTTTLATDAATLHSHCYNALGRPPMAETRESIRIFNEEHPQYAVSMDGSGKSSDEDNLNAPGSRIGDRLKATCQILRARGTPRDKYPYNAGQFLDRWEDFKRHQGSLDFSDLITKCTEDVNAAPGQPDEILVDEAQDLDPGELRLARKWGLEAGRLVMVGDPDQCQPPGTLVTTSRGPMPIEDLVPGRDRLITWAGRHERLEEQKEHHPFQVAVRNHTGRMLTIKTNGRVTRSTPNHLWTMRWNSIDTELVLLSRTRDGWTVATTNLRLIMNGEHQLPAGRTWALTTARSKGESMEEATIATRQIKKAKNQAAADAAAQKVLKSHGRDETYPIWHVDGRTQIIPVLDTIHASNLLPEAMSVPLPRMDGTTEWHPIDEIKEEAYNGPVYSLAVEPHKTYIADGIVTHNCLYGWRGSDPSRFTKNAPEDAEISILAKSHRIPEAVHGAAMDWIDACTTRQRIDYDPRGPGGEVNSLQATCEWPQEAIDDAERRVDKGQTVMIIASCAYMLENTVDTLRRRGIPYHNPQRLSNGRWNPMPRRPDATSTADRLHAFLNLAHTGFWSAADVRSWSDLTKLTQVMAKGTGWSERIRSLENDDMAGDDSPCLSWDRMHEIFKPETIEAALTGDPEWLFNVSKVQRQQAMEYPLRVAQMKGTEVLREEPKIIVGTIHSTKGGEADAVYIFPDLSGAGLRQWNSESEYTRASVYRLFYVAMTRAKESLIICSPMREDEGYAAYVDLPVGD